MKVTKAKIIHSDVKYFNEGLYRPIIKYEFMVDNKSYISSNVYLSGIEFDKSKEESNYFMERYKTGQEINIYYDQQNPKNSCILIDKISYKLIILTIVQIISILVFIKILIDKFI